MSRCVVRILLVLVVSLLAHGCVLPQPVPIEDSTATIESPKQTTAPTNDGPTLIESDDAAGIQTLWVNPIMPEQFLTKVNELKTFELVKEKTLADASIDISDDPDAEFSYYFVLAASYSTLLEEISGNDFHAIWEGDANLILANAPLYMTADTQTLLETLLGKCKYPVQRVTVENQFDFIDWREPDVYAVLPFDSLTPNLKVIDIDQNNILDKGFDSEKYPLKIQFSLEYKDPADTSDDQIITLSNRNNSELSRLLMTGTTALVRRLGVLMETKGMTYPVKDIDPWLKAADLIHISNEVSFADTCPPANWYQKSLQFCSPPGYIDLLEHIAPDIIELTGNHLIDWDVGPFEETLRLYEYQGWKYYGGGRNLTDARKAVLIEHNDNKFAFLGCNIAGPDFVWATDTQAGTAFCDLDLLDKQISELKAVGYLPIVTLQYYEYYGSEPTPRQERDFDRLVKAGAVIVQGSQAHVPQTFEVADASFIHYGLGNFLFDQMRNPDGLGYTVDIGESGIYPAVRLELLDLHTFYQGRLINTELLTAVLEESGKPRPMTDAERQTFLEYLYSSAR